MLELTSAAPPEAWAWPSTAGAGADTPLGRGPFAVAVAIFRVLVSWSGVLSRQKSRLAGGWSFVATAFSVF